MLEIAVTFYGEKMQDNLAFKKRILDLANRCDRSGIYTFSDFMGINEQALFFEMVPELSFVPYTLFGGGEDCERRMVRFGSPEMLGYEEDFPIRCLTIRPLAQKFADDLTHRDFLGALMHLGIDRDVLGDIIVRDNIAYLFCEDSIAEFLAEHLDKVKHTSVTCTVGTECPAEAKPIFSEEELVVSAARCDSVVAKAYKLSRSESARLFAAKRIFVNGRQCENPGSVLKEGDVVSIRGFGKFIFDGIRTETKKGRIRVKILRYI